MDSLFGGVHSSSRERDEVEAAPPSPAAPAPSVAGRPQRRKMAPPSSPTNEEEEHRGRTRRRSSRLLPLLPLLPLLVATSAAGAAPLVDKNANCAHWADNGECESNPTFMMNDCAASCSGATHDRDGSEACRPLVSSGACRTQADVALERCRSSCYQWLRHNLTDDTEGNCWYWTTDGECAANAQWMGKSCPRSCRKLAACTSHPHSPLCAEPFECPLTRDAMDEAECLERARRGECRPHSIWSGDSLLLRCPYTCAVVDPPSASHAVTRPMVKLSPHIDPPITRRRHGLDSCHEIGYRRPLLSHTCPHPDDAAEDVTAFGSDAHPDADIRGDLHWKRELESTLFAGVDGALRGDTAIADAEAEAQKAATGGGGGGGGGVATVGRAWWRRARRCPRAPRGGNVRRDMTPRISSAALPPPPKLPEAARGPKMPDSQPPVRLQLVSTSPRIRLLHDFVSAEEAKHLIMMATPSYHRSSTARAGSDDKRTSHSATLPSHDPVVAAVRQRISFFCGYPEANLEPLQAVRYHAGEFYKPHHDYYNACETWQAGNRHFTFLIYLNDVEAGGETAFPRLNLTISPTAYTALVFNNCLDNGEPDERSLHEGVAPSKGVKYAINGVRQPVSIRRPLGCRLALFPRRCLLAKLTHTSPDRHSLRSGCARRTCSAPAGSDRRFSRERVSGNILAGRKDGWGSGCGVESSCPDLALARLGGWVGSSLDRPQPPDPMTPPPIAHRRPPPTNRGSRAYM